MENRNKNFELNPIDFWDRVKRIAKTQKMTMIDVSQKTDISINTLYTNIKRNTFPAIDMTFKIANLLNVSSEFLVTGNDSRTTTETEKRILELEKENQLLKDKLSQIHNLAIN